MKKLGALTTLGFCVGAGATGGAGIGLVLAAGLAFLGQLLGLRDSVSGDLWAQCIGGGAAVGSAFGLAVAGVVLPLRAVLGRLGYPPVLANLAGAALFFGVPRLLWGQFIADAPVPEVEAAQVRRSGPALPGSYAIDHGRLEIEAVTVGDVRFSHFPGDQALQPGAAVTLSSLEGEGHPESCPGQVVQRDEQSLLIKRASSRCGASWSLRAEGTIGPGALLVPVAASALGQEPLDSVWVATPCWLCRLHSGSDRPTHQLTRRQVLTGWTTSGPSPELEIRGGLAEGEWVVLGFSPSSDGEAVRIRPGPVGP